MFIGPVKFDIEQQELVNNDTLQVLKLSNVEFLVMKELMSSRGRVVSTESLCLIFGPQVITSQDIAAAVSNIKTFLGINYASMIEAVTNQGYLLHTTAKVQMHNSPYEALSIKQFSMFLVIGIMLVVFLATRFETTPNIRFTLPEELLLDGKKSVLVPIYSSDMARITAEEYFKKIAVKVESCDKVAWDGFYVSTSDNGEIIHFVMQRMTDGVREFRNFKIVNIEGDWDFIDQPWLIKAGFCE
ncbi:helix-turn-helix domain-containing protein [Shewanella youngdeokensis]|uniref:Helix-turn-helix domain-containing protein n=1 Tax=Shewanella youngdeokensis TaxID=2999068 RepID=A0ABZ0K1R1_9GAMM|nr:helix-turn-helix domain-containing protein [Shewanella sp. DAU334]